MKCVQIHTDGACSGNPGPGGYGAVLRYKTFRRELAGGFRLTTNNRMEIFAVIAALELLTEPCEITLSSDSEYVVKAWNQHWLDKWRRSQWRKSDKQPVLNRDLWERLLAAALPHKLSMVWVKGHASDAENNRCDELAREAIAAAESLGEDAGFSGTP